MLRLRRGIQGLHVLLHQLVQHASLRLSPYIRRLSPLARMSAARVCHNPQHCQCRANTPVCIFRPLPTAITLPVRFPDRPTGLTSDDRTDSDFVQIVKNRLNNGHQSAVRG